MTEFKALFSPRGFLLHPLPALLSTRFPSGIHAGARQGEECRTPCFFNLVLRLGSPRFRFRLIGLDDHRLLPRPFLAPSVRARKKEKLVMAIVGHESWITGLFQVRQLLRG